VSSLREGRAPLSAGLRPLLISLQSFCGVSNSCGDDLQFGSSTGRWPVGNTATRPTHVRGESGEVHNLALPLAKVHSLRALLRRGGRL
jgi:hypothetical protein